ncbi:MAG TPA: di-heme oxidoredictase family protein, partial [Blastocatellia bacterium]|nr:di-heme oxidoredictase family protein [Blastocatellia bacterium]
RKQARQAAMNNPGLPQTVALNDPKHGVSYGVFKTTYTKGSKWKFVTAAKSPTNPTPPQPCPSTTCGKPNPTTPPPTPDDCDIGAVVVDGFTDDVGMVQGVAFDLIIRPFQWKGVASSIRHFVRDALDFHLSMQAVEKVGSCDCDKDGKINEVSIGNVSAITSFVGMTRPPQQMVPAGVSNDSVKRGYEIFTGKSSDPALQPKLSGQMCATCHTPAVPIISQTPQFVVDSPVGNSDTNCATDCPFEATGSYTSLVSPLASHADHPALKKVRSSLSLSSAQCPPADMTYNIPLNSSDVPVSALPRLSQTAPFFLPFLPQPPPGALYVPFFGDLKVHYMGRFLTDLVAQGGDVTGVCIPAPYFITRPLWGVADTGPWLHDGRATSLLQAIMLHGNSSTGSGSEAAPFIDAFEKLSPGDQQAVVNFLLSLRLPLEPNQGMSASQGQ